MESKSINNIVAVTIWYNPGMTECDAIKSYADDVTKVIIVDNSDNDNSYLVTSFQNVEYIPLHNNLGIAAALNVGCKRAIELNADWVLTMDQDSRWNQHSVRQFIDTATQYDDFDKTAIFSPFQDTDGVPQSHHQHGDFEPRLVVMCSGNLLRLAAWEQTNGFREDFFIDSVDDEMCCHLRQLGWKIIRVNKIYLSHKLGNGAELVPIIRHMYIAHSAWRYYYIARNIHRMMRLYPDMKRYYHRAVRQYIKRLLLYDWNDKRNKLREFHRGWRDGRE